MKLIVLKFFIRPKNLQIYSQMHYDAVYYIIASSILKRLLSSFLKRK